MYLSSSNSWLPEKVQIVILVLIVVESQTFCLSIFPICFSRFHKDSLHFSSCVACCLCLWLPALNYSQRSNVYLAVVVAVEESALEQKTGKTSWCMGINVCLKSSTIEIKTN